jgi:NADPH-dependent 7-cyano-7-deazaguanine reductase QueF-like protein
MLLLEEEDLCVDQLAIPENSQILIEGKSTAFYFGAFETRNVSISEEQGFDMA